VDEAVGAAERIGLGDAVLVGTAMTVRSRPAGGAALHRRSAELAGNRRLRLCAVGRGNP